jgi:hypothetical protein
MTGTRGWAVIDAVVSLGIAGIAVAAIAGTGGMALRALRVARDSDAAIALATERLEAMRAGPRANGSDIATAADGTRFTRTWRTTDGRGRVTPLSVDVQGGGHDLVLSSEVFP